MSGIVNKIKEAVHSDKPTSHHSAPEGTHGPHSSRVANAADPRVDSDRDNSHTMGGSGTTGMTGHTTGRTAGHGEYGTNNPFSSTTTGTGTGTGLTGSTGASEGTYGPHGSRLANAADPRIDSDRDGSTNMGAATSGRTGGIGSSGFTGTGTHTGTTHTGGNTLGGAAFGGSGGQHGHGHHTGAGPAPNTAGPHSSDMANKVDPRVDSDLDGSNTLGGNKTFTQ